MPTLNSKQKHFIDIVKSSLCEHIKKYVSEFNSYLNDYDDDILEIKMFISNETIDKHKFFKKKLLYVSYNHTNGECSINCMMQPFSETENSYSTYKNFNIIDAEKVLYDTSLEILDAINCCKDSKLVIYIDMDKTFCDYDKQAELYNKLAVTDTEKKYPQSMIGFFQNMEPMKGALEFYNKFKSKAIIYFLTRPSFYNVHSYTEKAKWMKRYNIPLERLILCPRKDLLIGDILIDDYRYDGQEDFKGLFMQFGTDEYLNWEMVEEKLLPLVKEKKNSIYKREIDNDQRGKERKKNTTCY